MARQAKQMRGLWRTAAILLALSTLWHAMEADEGAKHTDDAQRKERHRWRERGEQTSKNSEPMGRKEVEANAERSAKPGELKGERRRTSITGSEHGNMCTEEQRTWTPLGQRVIQMKQDIERKTEDIKQMDDDDIDNIKEKRMKATEKKNELEEALMKVQDEMGNAQDKKQEEKDNKDNQGNEQREQKEREAREKKDIHET